ncbi:MAG: glycosyltransferase family 2 protein [Bacteroidetes bacterium]|nr:glycosyltransferase family 2 protein [Bacteroidota bacterium]
MKDISVIIPLFNEDESLKELHAWIVKVMLANNYSYEVLFVDDGSKDKSWQVIEELQASDSNVRGIKFRRNYGKSAALQTGFQAANGKVVVTMDADLQDSPEEIPEMRKMIMEDGFDLVSGWKKKRYDPITKTLPTKLFNWATRKMSGIYLHDFNCGLKAYKIEVVKSIEVYGEMHRYIPVIAKWSGFNKIGEKEVNHRARKYGYTKFGGIERFIYGFLDLLSIMFVSKFGKKPLHLFGTLGFIMFLLGFGIAISLLYEKLFVAGYYPMTDRPRFYYGLLTMTIGTMFFLTGFLAELVARNSASRNSYLIEKEL